MEELEAEKVQLGDDLAAKVAEIGDLKITQSEVRKAASIAGCIILLYTMS